MEDSFGENHSNPLMTAIQYKNFEMVKYLAPKTENLNHQTKGGFTVLHKAVRNHEAFKYLITNFCSKINPNISTDNHKLPLHLVCKDIHEEMSLESRIEIVKTLITLTIDTDQEDWFGKSPVHYAEENGYSEIVELLLDKSQDNFLSKVCNNPDKPDLNGRLPIHLVCIKNSLNFDLSLDGRAELVKTLVILTSNINHQDTFGYTALHYAVENGFYELVKILAPKSDVNIRSDSKYKSQKIF